MDFFSVMPFTNTWVIIIIVLLFLIYRFGTSSFNYFSQQGIPGPKPIPYIGNLWGIWKMNAPRHDMGLVQKYGKVFGMFDGRRPNLFVADHELIRLILVRDFDHFVNRRTFDFKSKFIRVMLTMVRDQKWKDVRSSVSPAFTTGKIKRMSVLIKECADRLSDKLKIVAEKTGKIDAKSQLNAFTMEVIARCAFGMEIKHLGEKDDPFMKNASLIFNSPINKSPLILLAFIFPELIALYADSLFVTKEFKFFIDILENLVKERYKNKEKFNDFVDIATEAMLEMVQDKSGSSSTNWTREEVDEIVVAQSVLFLLAGFDTTGTTLTNACYLLAKHPDIQQKLYNIITERLEHFEDISHEFVLDLPYVDNFVNEVLRIYPPALRLERECAKDITYNGIHIKKGIIVSVPVYALHHLEEYYPDPEKFDPERWNPENKGVRSQYAFQPFGMGPRNCVGMRFAMEELKITLCTIVKNFKFFAVEETPEKLEMEDGFLLVAQPSPAVIGIESRN